LPEKQNFAEPPATEKMTMLAQLILFILFVAAILGMPGRAFGQEPFYRGKVLRIIVGFAPGGGYDTYTRLLSRHLGKHIPGNPVSWWRTWPAPIA